MGDAICLLELSETCHSQPRALAPSTHDHHNNKWPECNCAPAMLYLTSCSSRKCNNMTPLGNQACISRHRQMLHAGSCPVCLKTKSSFQLYQFYIEELKKKGPDSQPGHPTTIGKHHPSQHELLTRFGCKRFWRKVQISAIRLSVSLAIHKPNFVS